MAGFVRSDTDTTPLGIMMMAHSCQSGDDNDEDGEDNGKCNSYQQNTSNIGRPLFCPQTKMTTKSSPARLGDHHLGAVSVELGPQVLMLQGHLGEEEEIRRN